MPNAAQTLISAMLIAMFLPQGLASAQANAAPLTRVQFDAMLARVDNSSRWGAQDELGTLNFITPEKILKALQLKAAGKPARVGPAGFPGNVPWPEALMVTPPWEGGDGRASNEPVNKSARKADAGVEATAGVRS